MSSSAGASVTYNAGVTTNPLELLARQHAAEVLIQPLRLSAGRPASVPECHRVADRSSEMSACRGKDRRTWSTG